MTGRLGWHFSDGILAHGDGRKIVAGAVHEVEGPIVLCQHGLHAASRAIDAFMSSFSRLTVVSRVRVSGEFVENDTEFAGRRREYLAVLPSRPVFVEWVLDCAERALRYVQAGEERPRRAVETARRYFRGMATVEEIRAAVQAAQDADNNAFAARTATKYTLPWAAAVAARYAVSAAACAVTYVAPSVCGVSGAVDPTDAVRYVVFYCIAAARHDIHDDAAAERAWQERCLVSLLRAAIRAQRKEA